MQLVLNNKGLHLSKKNQSFYITDGESQRTINPSKLHAITVTSHCTLTSSAVRLAAKYSIPIYFLGAMGKPEGIFMPAQSGKNSAIRRKQASFFSNETGLEWTKKLLLDKIAQQTAGIRFWKNRYKSMHKQTDKALHKISKYSELIQHLPYSTEVHGTLMALEGNCSRQYWEIIHAVLPTEWAPAKRSRQHAKDPFNAALNYGYGMLYPMVETAIITSGLDRGFGVLHADSFGKPTLAYDLIEPFRVWVDSWLIKRILSGEILLSNFDNSGKLKPDAKKGFISSFYELMASQKQFSGSITSFKNHLYRYAGALVKQLEKS